ncbi:MAG: hypothetical protein CSA65_05710 [Proteobacteria bacterium]|nr:MAG: hypothetical protein CSB49_02040 [Pseudomonadota bacterium]PIE18213.1 MAG: hypothetical protein CSA65_05710 [Pseudomonadota bacterium]
MVPLVARPIPATSQRRWPVVACAVIASVAITGVLLSPRRSRAQSFERGGGGVATSLAGARAAAVTDATALWHNPAGLALDADPRRARLSLVAGLSVLAERSRYETTDHPRIHSTDGPRLAPRLAARRLLFDRELVLTLGYRLSWQRGLAFGRPLSKRTSPLPPLRFLGRRHESHEHAATLAIAGRRGVLAFGVAVEVGYASLGGEREIFAGGAADPLAHGGHAMNARWSLGGPSLGGRAGVLVSPAWWLRVGLAVELPRWSALSGALELTPPTRPPSGATTAVTRDGEAKTTLLDPLALALGFAMNLSRDLRLLAELGLRLPAGDASLRPRDATLVLDAGKSGERVLPSPELPLHPGRPIRWRGQLGLAWSLLDGLLTLRGGWSYVTAGLDGAPTSALSDLAHHRLALGLSMARGRWRASFALAHDVLARTRLSRLPLSMLPEARPSEPMAGELSTARTRLLAEVRLNL